MIVMMGYAISGPVTEKNHEPCWKIIKFSVCCFLCVLTLHFHVFSKLEYLEAVTGGNEFQ
jgi:hypothetical protein